MQLVSENILVLSAGEVIPEDSQEFLKIYLAGSIDLSESGTYNWQDAFINGLVELTDPNKGIIMFKNQKFLIINPRIEVKDSTLSLQNPEFVSKMNWCLEMMNVSDAIFCNFLKKSIATMPLFEFGLAATSSKMVVRCPDEYVQYPTVKVTCEKFNIPLLPGKVASVLSVIQSMYSYVPKFQEIQKLQLPE